MGVSSKDTNHRSRKADDSAGIPESRRAARRAVDLACEVITRRTEAPLEGRCVDLSPFGMALCAPVSLGEGESLVLSFHAPRDAGELTLFGRVRHGVEGDAPFGIEFEATSEEERARLAAALRGIPPRLPVDGAVAAQ